MPKRRLSRRDSAKLNRLLYSVFFANQGRVEGDVARVADALRRHGVNISELMGKSVATIVREAENEWLRKRFRDLQATVDGRSQRIYHYDGQNWLNMPLRLWLSTSRADEPDAPLRREELLIEIDGIIAQIPPQQRKLKAKVEGWRQIKAKVRAGEQYEQPSMMSDDGEQASA